MWMSQDATRNSRFDLRGGVRKLALHMDVTGRDTKQPFRSSGRRAKARPTCGCHRTRHETAVSIFGEACGSSPYIWMSQDATRNSRFDLRGGVLKRALHVDVTGRDTKQPFRSSGRRAEARPTYGCHRTRHETAVSIFGEACSSAPYIWMSQDATRNSRFDLRGGVLKRALHVDVTGRDTKQPFRSSGRRAEARPTYGCHRTRHETAVSIFGEACGSSPYIWMSQDATRNSRFDLRG